MVLEAVAVALSRPAMGRLSSPTSAQPWALHAGGKWSCILELWWGGSLQLKLACRQPAPAGWAFGKMRIPLCWASESLARESNFCDCTLAPSSTETRRKASLFADVAHLHEPQEVPPFHNPWPSTHSSEFTITWPRPINRADFLISMPPAA